MTQDVEQILPRIRPQGWESFRLVGFVLAVFLQKPGAYVVLSVALAVTVQDEIQRHQFGEVQQVLFRGMLCHWRGIIRQH